MDQITLHLDPFFLIRESACNTKSLVGDLHQAGGSTLSSL